jgi:hypothetical protein
MVKEGDTPWLMVRWRSLTRCTGWSGWFDRMDFHGTVWALLKGLDEAAARLGDVEVLVDRLSVPAIDEVLAGGGFVRMPVHGRGSHRFYVTYDADTDVWIKLDVAMGQVEPASARARTPVTRQAQRRRPFSRHDDRRHAELPDQTAAVEPQRQH